MKIIDFSKKGNVVRFYIGKDDCTEYYGDDWDDAPYQYNAGPVYDEYVESTLDVSFPFDWVVAEPSNDWRQDIEFCKEDFVKRNVPCIIAVPPEIVDDYCSPEEFFSYVGSDNCWKIYFGDSVDSIRNSKYAKDLVISWNE